MRICVLSDVHANVHALRAVLVDASRTGVDAIWNLGDTVGYGASPAECVDAARRHCDVNLAGNHDLCVTGRRPRREFNHRAANAARWSASRLDADRLAWLDELPGTLAVRGIRLAHASPRDPVWEYVTTPWDAAANLLAIDETHCLVGHSHLPLAFRLVDDDPDDPTTIRTLPDAGETVDLAAGRWLMNPGACGQPRDGDPRAHWLELDLAAGSATWRRCPYDVQAAHDAILATGELHPRLAERLLDGS